MSYDSLTPRTQLRFAPSKKSVASMKAPRTARHTRQQTLTQIDFVTRTPRFAQWDTDEDDEDLGEVRPPPPKRRRRSPTRRQAGEDDGRNDLHPADEATPQTLKATNARRGPSTPHTVRILEIPSSRRSPTQSPLFVKPEENALVEKSVNVQVLPGTVGKKRKVVGGKPMLEVKDSYAEENEMSQLPQEVWFSEALVSTIQTPNGLRQGIVPATVDEDEPTRTVQWKEGENSIIRQHDVETLCGASGTKARPPVTFSAKLEIQDSETEETSDDGDDDDEVEVKELEVSNNSTSPDSQQQTQYRSGDASDDEYLPSAETEPVEEESQYPIGLETQAVVNAIDLSSPSEYLHLQSNSSEDILLDPLLTTTTTIQSASSRPLNEVLPTPASHHDNNTSPPLPTQTQSSRNDQHPPQPLHNTPPQPSFSPTKPQEPPHPRTTTTSFSPPPPPPIPTSPPANNDDDDDALSEGEIDVEGEAQEEFDDDDDRAPSETMSQLLPESLMEDFVPPPPPMMMSTQESSGPGFEEEDVKEEE